jgi:hypothetical protein
VKRVTEQLRLRIDYLVLRRIPRRGLEPWRDLLRREVPQEHGLEVFDAGEAILAIRAWNVIEAAGPVADVKSLQPGAMRHSAVRTMPAVIRQVWFCMVSLQMALRMLVSHCLRRENLVGLAAEQEIEFLTEEAVKFLAELLIEIGHHPAAELEPLRRILGRSAGRLHDAVHGNLGTDDDFPHVSSLCVDPGTNGPRPIRYGALLTPWRAARSKSRFHDATVRCGRRLYA